MIVTEKVTVRGHEYEHTYSDEGFMIERDGVEYGEAYDSVGSGRVYTETENPIDDEEATAEDYESALSDMGVAL